MSDSTYDVTGSPAIADWLREHGIDPTKATTAQCVEAINATGALGYQVALRTDGRMQADIKHQKSEGLKGQIRILPRLRMIRGGKS